MKIDVNRRGGEVILDSPQISKRKHLCFTWNNYKETDVLLLIDVLNKYCDKYCFQKEIGDETKTPHLQGTLSFKSPMRWTELKLPKCIHWEATKDVSASYFYCEKEDTRMKGTMPYKFGYPIDCKVIDKLYKWQEHVVDYIKKDVNDREILWIYDPKGNLGKTSLAKYLIVKHDAICATSSASKDVANLLFNLKESGRDLNKKTTFLFCFGRSKEVIGYCAIESVKDGLITNTKYESGTMCFNSPHVIVLSNDYPNVSKLSKDRWNIKKLVDGELIDCNCDTNDEFD